MCYPQFGGQTACRLTLGFCVALCKPRYSAGAGPIPGRTPARSRFLLAREWSTPSWGIQLPSVRCPRGVTYEENSAFSERKARQRMSGFTTDPLRFMAWWAKLLFFVTAVALLQLCYLLLDAVGASSAVSLLFGVAFTSLAFVVAVRTFRGRAEPIASPRPWWRATARPTAGFVLGALTIWGAADEVWLLVDEPAMGVIAWVARVLSLLQFILIAGYFINSSVRLRALPPERKPAPSGLVPPRRSLGAR